MHPKYSIYLPEWQIQNKNISRKHFRRVHASRKNSYWIRRVSLSVRLSACFNSIPTGQIWVLLENSTENCREIQIWLKMETKIGHFEWRPKYFYVVESDIKPL